MISSLLTEDQKECGKRKSQSQQNIVKLYGILGGQCSHTLQSEAMSDTKFEDVDENYDILWLVDKLKLLCAGVDSYICIVYYEFHTLKDFYTIHQQSGEMVTKYFDFF